jgi:hypothetical protein
MSLEPDNINLKNALRSLDDALAHAQFPARGNALPERDVVVVGGDAISAGLDAQRVALGELKVPSTHGPLGGYDRVLCRTITGNVYEVKRTLEGAFVVSDARSGRERILEEPAARSLWAVVGERISMPKRHTGHVVQIVAVDSNNRLSLPSDVRKLCALASKNFGGTLFFEGASSVLAHGQKAPQKLHLERKPLLLVNGRGVALGIERTSFELKNLKPVVLGNKDALEVLFRTASGNIYGLIRTRKGGLILLNSRYGRERAVAIERLGVCKLVLGESFRLSKNCSTSPVSQVVVLLKAIHIPGGLTVEALRKHAIVSANGNGSTIRDELMKGCRARFGEAYLKQILRGS